MRLLASLLTVFAITLCACGGGSSSPSPTATPSVTPGPIVASPASVTLSLSGVTNPKQISGVNVTQANVSGTASFSFSTTNCWAVSTPIVNPVPNSFTSTVTNGTLSGSFGPITGGSVGSCSITITGSGVSTNLPVNVTL